MKMILSTACVLLSVAALAETSEVKPTADALLKSVVANLPTDPLHVSGDLVVRKRRGVPLATYGFELDAKWGSKPPRARYRIRDAFGRSLEELTITHSTKTVYRHAAGDPPSETTLTDLSRPIQDTDLSWMDLSLSFLWWPNGSVVGEESIRTFECYVVDIDAPADTHGKQSGYTRVRLWISKKALMLLQAEGYNADGDVVRRLWVKSCKKVDEQWMIKEMEVQRYPVVHRTKLRVVEVTVDQP